MQLIINLAVLLDGGSNFFFYLKASSSGDERRQALKRKYGSDFMRKMGTNSIVSYL